MLIYIIDNKMFLPFFTNVLTFAFLEICRLSAEKSEHFI